MYLPTQQMRPLRLNRGRGLALSLVAILGVVWLMVAQSLTGGTGASNASIQLDLSQLPLAFVPNAGQADPTVRFQAHDMGGTIFFTPEEVVLRLPSAGDGPGVVRMRFEGANPAPAITGGERLPGTVNYFRGDDPAQWRTGLPTYAGVVYQELYPGIDLRYDGTSGRLKGTYTVAPGADPSQIRWRHAGASQVQVNPATGDLEIQLAGAADATLVERAPVAWQTIQGRQVPVEVAYGLTASGAVHFVLGSYNPAYALTIDPTVEYSTYLGGSGMEDAEGIAVDGAGNVVVVGTTDSADFPVQDALDDSVHNDDVYVAKINAAGDALLFSTFLGGHQDEEGNGVALDSAGNIYIVGSTDSTNFPTQNPFQGANGGVDDAFVAKLSPSGDSLIYSTYLGGPNVEEGNGIAVDSAGNAYVVGATASNPFVLLNSLQGSYGGGVLDGFLVKLNSAGDGVVYGAFLGGNSYDAAEDVAVDGDGNAYVSGDTISTDFPTTASALQTSPGGDMDAFLVKVNSAGDALVYGTYLGGSGEDVSDGLAVNSAGEAYVVGATKSSDFPTQDPFQASPGGDYDAFLSKVNAGGDALVYSTYLGGAGADKGFGIALGPDGSATITGDTFSTDFPTAGSLQNASASAVSSDAFVARLSPGGDAAVYAILLGGSESDHGSAVAVDSAGNAYVAGLTASSDFPTKDPIQGSFGGQLDVFVAKISHDGSMPPTPTPVTPTATPTPGGPTPTPTVPPTVTPPSYSSLAASYKIASKLKVQGGEPFGYSIRLHNSGIADTTADVSDALPPELTYITGTVTGGGSYDANTRTLTWDDVPVPAGGDVELTFGVVANPTNSLTLVKNTAVITPAGDDPFERTMWVLVAPQSGSDDVELPVVTEVTIEDRDVLTDTSVTLHISATDNVGVTQMLITEWYLDSSPLPKWVKMQDSGWIPYEENYSWTLAEQSGVHFVAVWVADAASNVSLASMKSIDFASLLLDDTTVPQLGLVPYLVYYEAGVDVTATLTPSSGDPDLLVWYPGFSGLPNQRSTLPGPVVDQVSFTTPVSGPYLFLVLGFTESTYDLTIEPAGGPRMNSMGATAAQVNGQAAQAATADKEINVTPPLDEAGLDPLAVAGQPAPPTQPQMSHKIFIPVVIR